MGREHELAGLGAALERAADRRPAVVLVAGESGVGKTRLVSELAARARAQGARVLTGDCVDLGDGELAYAPIVSALRGLSPDELGAGAAGLAPLLPQLDAPETDNESALSQGRVFELLLGLLGRLGDAQPLMLVFEDVHWADRSSRDFLSFFVRNARHQRVLLVATYRTDELHRRHPLRALVAEAERAPIVERVALERFTRDEMVAQLTGILGRRPEARLVDELFARAEGNPFFTEELAAAAAGERVPANLADALMLRVEALSPSAQGALRLAAVAGPRVSHGLLEQAAAIGPDELVGGLREAVAHNIIVIEPETGAYGFRHALMREALADDLLPGERGPLHTALARALEADPELSVSPSGVTAELAYHWFAAHNLPAAFSASAQAGADAMRLAAFAESNAHYERAIELWDGVSEEVRRDGPSLVDLIRSAAEAAHLAGEYARAAALARRALTLVDARRRSHDRRAGRRAPGALPVDQRPVARGARGLPRRRRAAAADGDPAGRARVLGSEGHLLLLLGRGPEALELCEPALEIARAAGRAPRGGEHPQHHVRRAQLLGRPGAGVEHGQEALRIAARARRHRGAHARLRQPRRDARLGRADRGGGRAGGRRSPQRDRAGHRPAGRSARLRSGAAPAAAGALGRCRRRAGHRDGRHDRRGHGRGGAGRAGAARRPARALRRGQRRPRGGRARRRRTPSGRCGPGRWPSRAPSSSSGAGAPPRRATPSPPCSSASSLRTRMPSISRPSSRVGARAAADVAVSARATGDAEAEREAGAFATTLVDRARHLVRPEAFPAGRCPPESLLNVATTQAEHARAVGQGAAAAWREVAARWEAFGAPYATAYARWRLTEAILADGGARPDAQAALATAHAVAYRLRARPLAAELEALATRARLSLDSAGAPAPVTAGGDGAAERVGLTARELEVLRLVAAGETNRSIGQALYISEKTVSVHISRILAKLDVRGRVEAAGLAIRLGLLEETEAAPEA